MRPKPFPFGAELVRDLLDYNPDTGEFIRTKFVDRRFRGKPAGFIHHTGYRVIKIDYKPYFAQRLAWLHFHGECPGDLLIDHINRDKDDNRICNLRKATFRQNTTNSKARAASGFKGVYLITRSDPPRWTATISNKDGKTLHLGVFRDRTEAAVCYERAARQIYGEFVPSSLQVTGHLTNQHTHDSDPPPNA